MASLLQPQDDTDPNTATPSTSSGGADPSGATVPGTATPQSVNSQTANQQDVSQIKDLNQNVDFSPLLDYVRGQGTTARNAINTAQTDFNTQLGNFTPFGDTEKNTLTSVIGGL